MSDPLDPAVVERMQLEYEKDPTSKVFAPLADVYRKMGMPDEALRIAQAGVANHPNLPSGRVVLGRILFDQEEWAQALIHLERATQMAPDNRAAHILLGETLLRLRRPKDALKAYKMLLFLNPNDMQAQEFVKKWEFLTAEDYSEEVFANLIENKPVKKIPTVNRKWEVERIISLADALTIRNDSERAIEILKDARARLGNDPEITSRLRLLAERATPTLDAESEDVPNPISISRKRVHLEKILRCIVNYRKRVDPSRLGPR